MENNASNDASQLFVTPSTGGYSLYGVDISFEQRHAILRAADAICLKEPHLTPADAMSGAAEKVLGFPAILAARERQEAEEAAEAETIEEKLDRAWPPPDPWWWDEGAREDDE